MQKSTNKKQGAYIVQIYTVDHEIRLFITGLRGLAYLLHCHWHQTLSFAALQQPKHKTQLVEHRALRFAFKTKKKKLISNCPT